MNLREYGFTAETEENTTPARITAAYNRERTAKWKGHKKFLAEKRKGGKQC